ncbi:MAG TPA: hypothetical protein VFY64_08815 [Nitrososphaeraceae archaeon]|nr:hypothetical protein [Nitrososphaeraceae archaeon]
MSDFSIVLPADLIPRKKYGARTEAIGKKTYRESPTSLLHRYNQ